MRALYDDSLSTILAHNTISDADGILQKPIPDDSRPGRLDPREYHLLEPLLHASPPPLPSFLSIKELCESAILDRDGMGFPNLNLNLEEIHTTVHTLSINGRDVTLWAYWPRKLAKKKKPAFLYLHGGGWTGGSVFTVENPCRLLAERAGCLVFNLDYALAPEFPYPTALQECYETLKFIHDNANTLGIDSNRIGIGGDSAGGNLSAAVAMLDRDRNTNYLRYQALLYPAVTFLPCGYDDYFWDSSVYDTCEEQRNMIDNMMILGRPLPDGSEHPLSLRSQKAYLLHGGNPVDPYISPLHGHKESLCPALIATAEYDGLRIQGELYGKQLKKAGVPVRIIRYRGVGHAFLDKLGYLPQAEDLINEIAMDIQSL